MTFTFALLLCVAMCCLTALQIMAWTLHALDDWDRRMHDRKDEE